MTRELAGKVVLVTGGGKGVGRAVVLRFAARGAHVVINYFHSQEEAARTLRSVQESGGSGELVRASVVKPDQVAGMFDQVRQSHGGLDVLVNNAAGGVLAPSATLTDEEWLRVFEVNVHGARRCAWAALPLLAERRGAIVNVSSIGAGLAMDNYAAVGVSKAALEALTRYLAADFAPHGVRVNSASAGLLANPTAALFPEAGSLKATCEAATPLGRLGTEQELAALVVFLGSSEASWITGQCVLADGGLSLGRAMLTPGRSAPEQSPAAESPAATAGTVARRDEPEEETAVAVVGAGLVVPGASGLGAFWDLLHQDEPVFREPGDRFRLESFWSDGPAGPELSYSRVAGFIPARSNGAEAGTDMAVQWLRDSLQQAAAGVGRSAADRCAGFIGAWVHGDQHLEESLLVHSLADGLVSHWPDPSAGAEALRERLLPLLRGHYPHAGPDLGRYLPHRVVREAFHGLVPAGTPLTVIDTACASGLYAVDLAAHSLLAGECDIAFGGGIYANSPLYSVLFSQLKGLSLQGDVRSFDADADGTLFSDGAAVVVLKRLARAERDGDRILGVLAGFGAASDGRGKAIYAPNPRGQAFALQRARAVNALDAGRLDWVVAHATGTNAGDSTELQVLAEAAGPAGHFATSTKSLVGHTGWAAGAVSLVHALLGLAHEEVPAQARFTTLPGTVGGRVKERIHIPRVPSPLPRRGDRPRTVGVSAFGFGGTNAHLLVQDAPGNGQAAPRSTPPARPDPIVLVGWAAHLPGTSSREQVLDRLAAGLSPAEQASFGPDHPLPPAEKLRLPPSTIASLDRAQLLAFAVADRFAAEHGPLWQELTQTTGIVAAHTGPLGIFADVTARSYALDLERLLDRPVPGLDPGHLRAALSGHLAEVRGRRQANSEDTLPALMPNVLPARLANYLDLCGLAAAVDTGATSAQTALHVAAYYLRSGYLDLALVLALNANTSPATAEAFGVDAGCLAEGAVLLGITRLGLARERGWPVLHTLKTALPDTPETGAASVLPYGKRTYLAVDGALDLLAAVARSRDAAVTADGLASDPAPPTAGADAGADATALTQRYELVWEPEPAGEVLSNGALPPRCLVLTDTATAGGLAAQIEAAGATLLGVGVGDGDDSDAESSMAGLAADAEPFQHIRVLVDMSRFPAWPALPTPGLLALQETMFLAARAHRDTLAAGGSFGVLVSDPMPGGVPHPHCGLFTGFVKSLSWELPETDMVCVLSDVPAPQALQQLADELRERNGLPVVIRRGQERYVARLQSAPARSGPIRLQSGAVVVATGGARGLTSAIVEELARHLPLLELWLLGSNRLADLPGWMMSEDVDLPRRRLDFLSAGLKSEAGTSMAELNRRFDRLVHAAEAHRFLHRLRERLGGDHVHFLTCDITDAEAVRAAAAHIHARHDRVDLLINGAGLHHPCHLEAKTLAGFRRIRDVKLLGYHHLKNAFAGRPPRLWCNFGSVAGLVGLPGETDYSPANEFLATAAHFEHAVGGREESTIAWTLWNEIGLGASPIVQAYTARRQHLSRMSTLEGVAHFMAELHHLPHSHLATFLGDAERASIRSQFPGLKVAAPPSPARATARQPRGLLGSPEERSAGELVFVLGLDLALHPYLTEHCVDDRPTLPGTFLLEVAAEAAISLHPGSRLLALEDARFEAFVRPHPASHPGNGPARFRVHAKSVADGPAGRRVSVSVTRDITAQDGSLLLRDRPCFGATVVLGVDDGNGDGDAPAETAQAPERATAAAGTPVADPYYLAGSPVALSGIFRTTRNCRADADGAWACWQPDPAALPEGFAGLILPCLLLDALARTPVLRPHGLGGLEVAVPTALRRLQLYTADNDLALARRHPEGIVLYADSTLDQCWAVTTRGDVVAHLAGIGLAYLGETQPTASVSGEDMAPPVPRWTLTSP